MKPIRQAIVFFGSRVKFAERLGVTPQAVMKWEKSRIPAERVAGIVEATGGKITSHQLRPDIFPKSKAS